MVPRRPSFFNRTSSSSNFRLYGPRVVFTIFSKSLSLTAKCRLMTNNKQKSRALSFVMAGSLPKLKMRTHSPLIDPFLKIFYPSPHRGRFSISSYRLLLPPYATPLKKSSAIDANRLEESFQNIEASYFFILLISPSFYFCSSTVGNLL